MWKRPRGVSCASRQIRTSPCEHRGMPISAEEAQPLALAWLANDEWEPAVVRVEDAGDAWRVFYNSRIYLETKAVSHALAGNLPVLVDKANGAVSVDSAWRP